MKRTERHHLKEDEIAHGLSWFFEFFKAWRREIFLAAGALALAALIFAGLTLVRAHALSVQSRVVGEVGDLADLVAEKPEKLADLEKLAGEKRYGRRAGLELARYWAERGDWAKAEAALGRLPGSAKDLLYYQAEDLKAQLALGKKDYDRAIGIYEAMRDEKPKVYPLDAVLFHLAECYELKGDTAEALTIYKKLQEGYTQSYYGYEASLKATRLGAPR